AGDPLAGDIDRGDAPVEVVRVDKVVRVLEELAVPLLAEPQLVLGALALGDVLRHRQPRAPAAEDELERRHLDVEHRAVLFAMPMMVRGAPRLETRQDRKST